MKSKKYGVFLYNIDKALPAGGLSPLNELILSFDTLQEAQEYAKIYQEKFDCVDLTENNHPVMKYEKGIKIQMLQ